MASKSIISIILMGIMHFIHSHDFGNLYRGFYREPAPDRCLAMANGAHIALLGLSEASLHSSFS